MYLFILFWTGLFGLVLWNIFSIFSFRRTNSSASILEYILLWVSIFFGLSFGLLYCEGLLSFWFGEGKNCLGLCFGWGFRSGSTIFFEGSLNGKCNSSPSSFLAYNLSWERTFLLMRGLCTGLSLSSFLTNLKLRLIQLWAMFLRTCRSRTSWGWDGLFSKVLIFLSKSLTGRTSNLVVEDDILTYLLRGDCCSDYRSICQGLRYSSYMLVLWFR